MRQATATELKAHIAPPATRPRRAATASRATAAATAAPSAPPDAKHPGKVGAAVAAPRSDRKGGTDESAVPASVAIAVAHAQLLPIVNTTSARFAAAARAAFATRRTKLTLGSAKALFALNAADLNALPYASEPNPHYTTAAPMRLYDVDVLRAACVRKFGGEDGLAKKLAANANAADKRRATIAATPKPPRRSRREYYENDDDDDDYDDYGIRDDYFTF